MGPWYWIGVSAGLGVAVGVLLAGAGSGGRGARIAVILLAGAAGAGIGFAIGSWQPGGWGDRAAGIAGGLAGAFGATQTVSGALRRGGARLAASVFPSLTPVCLTSIATGAGPGVHHIPSLVWWSRQERRIVEYGSSFAALRAAGLSQSLLDPIFNMNARHLAPGAVTIYEALAAA